MNNLNCQSQKSEKTVQKSCAPSPTRGGVSRPVMAINRVFLTSIDGIRKDQDRNRSKKTSSESDPPGRVELAEDIKVKVQVETNNNTPTDEDCIHLQDREEPSGAEGDDDCEEDLGDTKTTAVEDHEDIQVKVFTHSDLSPGSPPSTNFENHNQCSIANQDECAPVPPAEIVETYILSDTTDSESPKLRKKSKKKKCKRKSSSITSPSNTDQSGLSPNREVSLSMAESPSKHHRKSHSRSRDRSKSPRHSRRTHSPRRDLSVSPSSRDSRRHKRSRSSRTSSRDESESPRRNSRRHHKTRDDSKTPMLSDRSESSREDARPRHKSRESSKAPGRISGSQKYYPSSPEKMKNSFDQEKFVESSFKSNRSNHSVLKGTEIANMLPSSKSRASNNVGDIPLPPDRMSSSDQYVDEIESSEDEMVDYTDSSKSGGASTKSETYADIVKRNAPDHTPPAPAGPPQLYGLASPPVYYNSPNMFCQPPPPYYYYPPQSYHTPPPVCVGGVFQWSTPKVPPYLAESPTSSQRQEPSQSCSLAQVSTLSPAPAEVDKKFQCLQNLHTPPRPNFKGYQLIGDSMLLRFSQQLLGDNAILAESLRFLGYCVSGQRVGDLLRRLRSGFYHLGKRVVVMIGTNDLLRSTPARQMCTELGKVVQHLKENMTEEIIILTLPPIPRLQNQTYHWQRLQQYNDYIKQLADKGRSHITPLDISKIFTDHRISRCRLELFEMTFSDNGRKDQIHLNNKGLKFVKDQLDRIL
ncbi:hypothetical protein FOCC_FOCC015776 [Frankliniella occidentalis]|uniref:Uncharacterized protein LOC113217528 isoform X2 n=1 Tax=Frankliniella occidentalis TaxID=133901 RepID=A0A6J1TJ09_FRAOC|nr:uncharacterized protein LOC113217528 isoform X2 [Frankliniella occidentalis]KAE8738730.1 hypothetical protein FOCC_FOCC015776 [Frankliniella occidentalis]